MSFLDVQASARLRESLYGNEDVGKTREGKESSAKGCHILQEKTKVCVCVPDLKQKSNSVLFS